MVKSYLRYEPRVALGLVVSPAAHAPAAVLDRAGRTALAAAGENVVLWEVKRGVQVGLWRGEQHEVTALALSPDGAAAAVGYADGSIQLWAYPSGTSLTTFNGHRNAVTALAFDAAGTRLASGARDTDVIVWDVVGERGLYRLRGHKDAITGVRFLRAADQLLTTSKDTLVKLWDLPTTHCVETLVAHRSEVWAMALSDDEGVLVTGSSDAELLLWRVDVARLGQQLSVAEPLADDEGAASKAAADESRAISLVGPVQRSVAAGERVVSLRFVAERLLVCQAQAKELEIFQLFDEKVATKKASKKGRDAPLAADRLSSLFVLRSSGPKIVSFDTALVDLRDVTRLSVRFLLAMQNNSLEVHRFTCAAAGAKGYDSGRCESAVDAMIQREGMRGDVRAVALAGDVVAAAATNTVKLFSLQSRTCVRSIEGTFGSVLCVAFTPGNRHVVVGSKTGALVLYDVASGELVFSDEHAHAKALWGLQITPDGKGLVTGSADRDVKFWEFELVTETGNDGQSVRRLTLVLTRTLQMTDEVLALRCSPDGKFIAVALLDATIKVFYSDSLKFYLSLYGHKLPVMSIDISADSTLLISGSADKSVKIWGLDFGDCHRSLLAHGDAVTAVQFIPNTHYFFSAGKDRLIKYWDGDKFELVQRLGAPASHHGIVWSMAVSRLGDLVVTGGADRAVRVAERTDEQVFVEEEREREMEVLFEEGAERTAAAAASAQQADGQQLPPGVRAGEAEEGVSAGKATAATLRGAEKLIEAMDLAEAEQAKRDENAQNGAAVPTTHPLLVANGALSPSHYVLLVLATVPSAELEEALLMLPFADVLRLLRLVDGWLASGWKIELSCRVLFFLLATHQDQLVASREHRPMLDSLRTRTRAAIEQQKDVVGFNLAALGYARRAWESNSAVRFFDAGERLDGGQVQLKRPRLVGT